MTLANKARVGGVVVVCGVAAWILYWWEKNKVNFPSLLDFLKAILRSPTAFGFGSRMPGALEGNSPPATGNSDPDTSQPGMSITVGPTGTTTVDNGPESVTGAGPAAGSDGPTT